MKLSLETLMPFPVVTLRQSSQSVPVTAKNPVVSRNIVTAIVVGSNVGRPVNATAATTVNRNKSWSGVRPASRASYNDGS